MRQFRPYCSVIQQGTRRINHRELPRTRRTVNSNLSHKASGSQQKDSPPPPFPFLFGDPATSIAACLSMVRIWIVGSCCFGLLMLGPLGSLTALREGAPPVPSNPAAFDSPCLGLPSGSFEKVLETLQKGCLEHLLSCLGAWASKHS